VYAPTLASLILAEALHSMSVLIAASFVAGAAMALGYRGSLQVVNEIAPAEHRAEMLSSFLLACYSGNSIPVIGVGLLALKFGAMTAHRAFAVLLVALAIVAAAIHWRQPDHARSPD